MSQPIGRSTVRALCVIMLAAFAVAADEPGGEDFASLSLEDLMQISISVASLKEAGILDAPSMVTVIDRDMIEEYNLQSVAEAVNLVAGMSVVRTYLKRDLPTARGVLQDSYANKVLVLIDGVPTWHGVTGEGALARIDIHDVERIEVLKGPASVLYGTNAYSGAINIVLRSAANASPGLQIGIAENSGYRAGGHYVAETGEVKVFLSGNAVDNNSPDFTFVDESGVSGLVEEFIESRNFTGQVTAGHHSAMVNAYRIDESYLGVTPTFAAGAGNPHLLEGVLCNYTFSTPIGSKTTVDTGLTYDWNSRDLSRTADDSVRASIVGDRLAIFGKAVADLSERFNLEGGIDLERRTSSEYRNYDTLTDETLADNNMRDREVDEYSGFLQLGYTVPRFRFVVGARFTDNELFGNDLSSRATLVFKASSSSSIKLNLGQSYRVPSLFELYFQTPTNTVWGNTELEPEKNDTVELAYLGSFGNLFIEALVYHADYKDRIFRTRRYPNFTSDPTDTSTIYVNGDEFSADGVELSMRYQQEEGINAFFNYTFTDGDDGDRIEGTDSYNFKYIPEHAAAAGVAFKVRRFLVSGVVTYQSEVGAPLEDIGDQTTFDLTLGYRHRSGSTLLRHYLTCKNLADDPILIPEYVRQRINEVPSGYGRRISYNIQIEF
ncbi:MAG: TonB-dependent receptor [Thermoanaerobaculales bacterium]|jgi:outer membrane receptor protein involved in Fe transport|nr:TonB-dependent receptor [Thermoanaerobaculales bacterium]